MANEDEDEEDESDESQNKKDADRGAKKFFSLIIVVIVMLLVIGGVTAAYFTGLLDPVIDWAAGDENENKETASTIDKQQDDKIKILIDLDPFAIPVFQGNSVAATVQIKIKLETNDEEKSEKIRKILPIISDAFISDLHGFMPRLLKAKKQVDFEIIKQRLHLIANKVAGEGTITGVFAESPIEQPK